jgi:hypothetical protein
MEILILFALAVGVFVLKNREQQQRIALLGGVLSRFEIEKLMETLMEGYLRALGEDRPERQAQVWGYLSAQEDKLCGQFRQFADAFAEVWADNALISKLPVAVPWAHKLFPVQTFDARKAFLLHAKALDSAMHSAPTLDPKDRAFTITAELMLMQHTCHWFCRSKAVASTRLWARHKTAYPQVVAAVAPATRTAYLALVQGP